MSDPFASRSVVWEGWIVSHRVRLIVDRQQTSGQPPVVFAESMTTDGLGQPSWFSASDEDERAALKAAVFVAHSRVFGTEQRPA